jgi:hypothetical protein
VANQAALLYFTKAFVDHVKHFYLTNLNKLTLDFYSGLRNDIFKKLHYFGLHGRIELVPPTGGNDPKFTNFAGETECDIAQNKVKWTLLTSDLVDGESAISMSRNFSVLPQLCVILRTVAFICVQKRYTSLTLWYMLALTGLWLAVVRIVMKSFIEWKIRGKV